MYHERMATTAKELPMIASNVQRLRKAAGMTQQQLAAAAGLSITAVSQIEQGQTPNPRADTIRALARALSCTTDDILNDTPDDSAKK